MIVAGIGSRRGVSAGEVVAAIEAALAEHGLERSALTKLATTAFKRGEEGIFEAGEMMGLEVVVVETAPEARLSSPPQSGGEVVSPRVSPSASPRTGSANRRGGMRHGVESPPLRLGPSDLDTSPPLCGGEERHPSVEESSLSLKLAGVESVSEAAALAAAGEGARLAGPRVAVGRVTCAIAFGDGA